MLERCQAAGPIGTRCGNRIQIHQGLEIGKTINPSQPQGAFGGGQGVNNSGNKPNSWTDREQLCFFLGDKYIPINKLFV